MVNVNDVKNALTKEKKEEMTAPAVNTFNSLLNSMVIKKKFEEVLGNKSPGFLSSLLTLYNNTFLKNVADKMSIVTSAMIAATLDLPINQNLGFAYIIPYKGKAQFQMGWKGFVQLAMRTGRYKTINTTEVYEGELIESDRFTGIFRFDSNQKKSDKIVAYVAYFKLLNGFEKYLYMTKEQIETHGRKYSKSFGNTSGIWNTNFNAMALKTPLKLLLSKFGILSIEMQKAIESDQAIIKEDGTPLYLDNNVVNTSTGIIEDENIPAFGE